MKQDAATPKLPGKYVECPVPLLEADLSALAMKLWLIIKAHCIKTEIGFPGINRLAKVLRISRTWTLALISELEAKGFLPVERRKGKANRYCPMIPTTTSQAELTSQPQLTGQAGLTNQSSGVDGGSQVELTRIIRTESEEINQNRQPSADAAPATPEEKDSKRTKTPQKPTDPRVKQLIDYFSARHLEKFGHKYTVSGAKDGKNLKDLLSDDHAPEIITACMDLFFADTDEWLDGKRTIPVLRSRFNSYVQQLSSNPQTPVPLAYRKLQ